MAETVCYPMIRGRRFRFTALDGCGRRKTGACVSIVSDGIVTASITSRTEDAEAVTVVNSNGRRVVNDVGTPSFSGHGAEIALAEVNPDLIGMLSGNRVIYHPGTGAAVGFRTSTKIDLSQTGFALEIWTDVPGVVCDDVEAQGAWGYILIPFLSGGVLGDFEIGNAAVNFTISGAATKDSAGWGAGPYNVVLDAVGAPSPLWEPMESHEPMQVIVTNLAPPEAGCSCAGQGIVPLTAIAGIPGTFGPTDAYTPVSYEALDNLTASPAVAWTTGQYVKAENGDEAYWSGTVWMPGRTP